MVKPVVDWIKNTVIRPAADRLGTVAAGFLVMGGDWMCTTFEACGLVTQDGADMVVRYLVAVVFLAMDVLVIHVERKKGLRK